jgi:signal transduction histidine kinase
LIKARITKIQNYIIGNSDHYSLEQRLLLFALIMGFFMGLLGAVTNYFITNSAIAALIPLLLTVFTFILYYFVRFKHLYKQLSITTAVSGIIGISIVWVFNGGIDGPNTMVAIAIFILALVIVTNRAKVFILLFFILINIFILLIQIYKPHLIVGYASESARWIDYLVCLIYSAFFIFLIIRFLHKHYTIERKRAEENENKVQQKNDELQKRDSDKDRFMQILAHDLRNPFNSLIGYSDLLIENIRVYDIDKIEKQLLILNKVSHSTFDLLEDLLLWSNSQSGKLPLEAVQVQLSELCSGIIATLKAQADVKNISINFSENWAITVFADKNMLKTILRNLVSNAIKFTPNSGQITIHAEKNDKDVTISVSDNGVGIDAQRLSTLWDFTQRTPTSGTENEKGTGFGLLLCKEFVEKHGSKIWVESELGKGSDFKFTLPLCKE